MSMCLFMLSPSRNLEWTHKKEYFDKKDEQLEEKGEEGMNAIKRASISEWHTLNTQLTRSSGAK